MLHYQLIKANTLSLSPFFVHTYTDTTKSSGDGKYNNEDDDDDDDDDDDVVVEYENGLTSKEKI